MQQIFQPLENPESKSRLSQFRILPFHDFPYHIRIVHTVPVNRREVLPVRFPGIAPYAVKYMVSLLGQGQYRPHLRQHTHQQMKVLVQLVHRKGILRK